MSPCGISKEKAQFPSRPVLLSRSNYRSSTLSEALTLIHGGRTHVRMWWAGVETHLAALDGDRLKRWDTDFLFLSASVPTLRTVRLCACLPPAGDAH